MGIRFHCPNGHRLNVKSFLAGKMGICPECGVKMRIPDATDAPNSENERTLSRTEAPSALDRPVGNRDPLESSTAPNALASGASVAELPATDGTVPDSDSTTSWYVRPVAGGQYGPADTKTFRQWVREGRVTEDALIWRDGWQSWQPAREVMEFKLALHGESPPTPNEPIVVQSETDSDGQSPVQRYHTRKTRQTKRNVSTIIVLGVIAILLLMALLYVIISQV